MKQKRLPFVPTPTVIYVLSNKIRRITLEATPWMILTNSLLCTIVAALLFTKNDK